MNVQQINQVSSLSLSRGRSNSSSVSESRSLERETEFAEDYQLLYVAVQAREPKFAKQIVDRLFKEKHQRHLDVLLENGEALLNAINGFLREQANVDSKRFWAVGDRCNALWQGKPFPARINAISEGSIFVTYDGFENQGTFSLEPSSLSLIEEKPMFQPQQQLPVYQHVPMQNVMVHQQQQNAMLNYGYFQPAFGRYQMFPQSFSMPSYRTPYPSVTYVPASKQ